MPACRTQPGDLGRLHFQVQFASASRSCIAHWRVHPCWLAIAGARMLRISANVQNGFAPVHSQLPRFVVCGKSLRPFCRNLPPCSTVDAFLAKEPCFRGGHYCRRPRIIALPFLQLVLLVPTMRFWGLHAPLGRPRPSKNIMKTCCFGYEHTTQETLRDKGKPNRGEMDRQ